MSWYFRRLRPDHSWRTRDGCRTLVLDRGVVQFDYPRHWSVTPGAGSVALFDRKPPKGNRLEISFFRVSPDDFDEVPVADLVDGVTATPRANVTPGPLREEIRHGIELSWRDLILRPTQPWRRHRAMCLRVCIARYGSVHCLMTYEFRCRDRARCDDAWETVLATLVLDRQIADAATGPP